MITKLIKADFNLKFLSEVIPELPSKVLLNKGVTGCGGTTLEIKSNRDSIILVPTINLVINKTSAHYNLIGVYGDVSKLAFMTEFCKRRKYKKIIATYDSLPKLIDWIGEEIFNYFLLIDEYHILFNSYSFRYEAITNVLSNFRKFKDYCFMTATPLTESTILEELKDIDVWNIEWPQAIAVNAIVENVYFTSKRVVELIEQSLNKDYNLHIFINSINTIRSIIKNSTIKDFRTICSKQATNEDRKAGGKLNVDSINSLVRKVNFYTATAFEGVDIYDPIGKTIVVSDTNIAQSLMDISTLFIQICGRLRDSIYKNEVLFICNTNNHRYLQHKTNDEFQKYSDELTESAIVYGESFLKQTQKVVDINLGSYEASPEYYQGKYIGRKFNILDYDPNLKKVDIQNYNIINNLFKSSISVIYNLNKTAKIVATNRIDKIYIDIFNKIPKLQLTYDEVINIIYPILTNNNIATKTEMAVLINKCSNRRRSLINGRTLTIYDFTKLKSMIH